MHCHLPIRFHNTWFRFNRWLGLIIFSNSEPNIQKPKIPITKKKAFECVADPYKLKKPIMVRRNPPKVSFWVKSYAKVLTYLCRHCYPLAQILFSNLSLNVFEDGEDANWYYRSLNYGYNQDVLCLPRAMFIASTSKKFKDRGVMFIGIFPPMRNLHA